MNRYTGDECAVCNVTFNDNDDVVVCPVCGTPYHRACYNSETGCVNQEWHGNTTYEKEKAKKREETAKKCENDSTLRCPKCSAQNPPNGLFCQVCGTSLRTQYNQNTQNTYAPPPITPNPFTTPFGGLSPDEEIDNVSAKELAVFVGNNSFYYIPRMKEIRKNEKMVSWNWSAFFFDFLYFFYRKMYGIGALVMSLYIASSVPQYILFFKKMAYDNIDFISPELQSLSFIADICTMLFFGIKVLCGLFGNFLYTENTFKKINKIRESSPNPNVNATEYVNRLSESGRVNQKVIIIFFVAEIILMNAVSILFLR